MGEIADQGNDWMREYVTDGDPDSGIHQPEPSAGRTLFDLIDGLVYGTRQSNADTTAPDDPTYGTPWLDTTTNVLNFYDGASWIALFSFDTVGHTASLEAVMRGYLGGLTLSNNSGTPNSKIDVSAGQCADGGNATMMKFLAGTIDCGTTGANGLAAADAALANNTWYHAFAIGKADGTRAFFAATSLTPTLPSGYTLKRRLGSFKTDGSAHILAFVQDGDRFRLSATVLDVNTANPGTSAVTATLASVPTGAAVDWFGNVLLAIGSTASTVLVSELAAANEAPIAYNAAPAAPGFTVGNDLANTTLGAPHSVRTNTSAQLRYRVSASDASVVVGLVTQGWIDRRGRDD